MDDPTTTITITPTLSQPVKLECQRTGNAFKDWFTGDPRSQVTPTEGEISTKFGHVRTLLISSFQPIHATTYSCVMDLSSSISAIYPVVLGTYIYTVYTLIRHSKLCIVIYIYVCIKMFRNCIVYYVYSSIVYQFQFD